MKKLSYPQWRMLLNHFTCGSAEMRPALEKPFEQSGYVCATDTHIIITVDKELVDGDFVNTGTLPTVSKVIPKGNSTHTVNIGTLRNALANLNINCDLFEEECPECDEEGAVKWEYIDKDGDKHHMYGECPCCHGSRCISNGIRQGVEINNTIFSAHYILLIYRTMAMLGITETKILPGQLYHGWRFNLAGGITIVVMPISKASPNMSTFTLRINPLSKSNKRLRKSE